MGSNPTLSANVISRDIEDIHLCPDPVVAKSEWIMNGVVREKLESVHCSGVMTPETVDFSMKDPERIRNAVGGCVQFSARVEGEVDSDGLMTILPRLGSKYRGYQSPGAEFLWDWVPQERGHADILEQLLRSMSVEPLATRHAVPWHNHAIGLLGTLSPRVHQVIEMVYYSQGAMQEILARGAYFQTAKVLEKAGERALVETIFRPMGKQEGLHTAFYRHAAEDLRDNLSPRQLAMARRIVQATYAPVGAGADTDKPHMGHVISVLAGDEVETFSKPVQRLADRLLDMENDSTVVRAIKKCQNANQAAPYALAVQAA